MASESAGVTEFVSKLAVDYSAQMVVHCNRQYLLQTSQVPRWQFSWSKAECNEIIDDFFIMYLFLKEKPDNL